MRKKVKKIVLAYSGGLDTSVIIPWLIENYKADVVAFVANIGQKEDWSAIKKKAIKSGASKVVVKDLKDTFVHDYFYPVMRAGAIYEGRYLLGTSLARPLIASEMVKTAWENKADAVSHGATGKGNDQVRFELTVMAMDPSLVIIAPWREWEIRSRSDAVRYAKKHNIPVPVTKDKPYSSDENLLHISYEGGILEDPKNPPDNKMFRLTVSPERAPNTPAKIKISFEKGYPVKIDDISLSPSKLLETLNNLAGKHGIGRVDIVENRLVGMKSRGVYETPGGTVLYYAHKTLEHLTLDRETMHFKETISHRYAELVYNGQWFSDLKAAIDAFVKVTQKNMNGDVILKLYKGNISTISVSSPTSLYNPEIATFEEGVGYDHADAGGFIRLFGLPMRLAGVRNRKKRKRS